MSNPGLTRHKASWKLIQPPDSILSPRDYPVVVPLNAFEIAILGDQSNVILFNIKTETCKKAISDLPYEFYPKRSQAVQIRPNQFVFLRCSFDQNVLVKCIGSERSFKILNKYKTIQISRVIIRVVMVCNTSEEFAIFSWKHLKLVCR